MSKAYDIGPGKLMTSAELKVQGQSPINLNMIENQSFCKFEPRQVKVSQSTVNVDTEEEISFEGNVRDCSSYFTALAKLQYHISSGSMIQNPQTVKSSP